MQKPGLSVEHLCVSLGGRTILADVCLQASGGESVAVFGRSGSGKTTLLSAILGLLTPDSGRVFLGGEEMTGSGARRRARLRRRVTGAVFQSGELLPELSARENVAFPALLNGEATAQALARADDLLASLGVPAQDRPIGTFSGGEQQRVAVARAMINSPRVVVADEPTGSLDEETAVEVQELLLQLPSKHGCALVVVTHDRAIASRVGAVAELRDGTLTVIRHADAS